MWTKFWDMSSGGGRKEKWDKIFIEAPEEEAKVIFYNRFGHSPDRVSCTCCGPDYSISEYETLEEATMYHRQDATRSRIYKQTGAYVSLWDEDTSIKPISIKAYEAMDHVLIIRKKDIKPEDRVGDVPEQGYVWID